MTATATLGKVPLLEALRSLKEEVRRKPADVRQRVYLFQLLAVLGEWDKALTQLDVCGELDKANLALMHMYRAALQGERQRARVYQGVETPLIFGQPEPWIASLVESLRVEIAGQSGAAQRLRDLALAEAPATAGAVTLRDGESPIPFSWIADADSRLGPMLEAIINGNYYWIHWQNIQSIHLEAPTDLRDMVWLPAHFTWTNGGEVAGFVPTRYPGSEADADDGIRLARKTNWLLLAENAYAGRGQRMWTTDTADYAMLDVRTIQFSIPAHRIVNDADGESARG